MGLYTRYILPTLLHLVMQNAQLTPYRSQVVSQARGRVVEVGFGSGLNLPYYGAEVTELYGIEPSTRLLAMARKRLAGLPYRVELMVQSAEALPFDTASIDTVVSTWSLCTIPDVAAALRHMRRVLKPGGRLCFAEHGLSPEPHVARWQHRLTPLWKRLAGGCHLDRDMRQLLQEAGFTLTNVHTTYLKGPRPATYLYWGDAVPAAPTT